MDSPQSSAAVDHDPRMEALVRRHAHDVRNFINTLNLEATLLEELGTDPMVISCAQRMKTQLSQLEATIRSLSVKFAEPQLVSLTSGDLLQLWKYQVAAVEDKSRPIHWSEPTEDQALTIDNNAMVAVLRDLLNGAQKRSRKLVKAGVETTPETVSAFLIETGEVMFAADEMEEHRRLTVRSGGTFEQNRNPVTDEWVTKLVFPVSDD